ncbi:MAG: hypothetical protein EHM49_00300 [Deltaproteobacteria bacterium]|nr:MAG: hypothetical protein EHM49_00300 [Deltaproteobacteria bacterium]
MLEKRDYANAVMVQNACNLSGVVREFAIVCKKIWDEAWEKGHGTTWVNTHPICRMYAEQINFLASGRDYMEAYEECEKKGGLKP